jgi:hypothetical protein
MEHNKWKFWFVALIVFSILNAALTALVFNAGGVLQTYMGSVLVGVGALLAWLGVCALYYSDSSDAHLSRGVAALDSITLLFVVAHFSFLLWVYGHLSTLQNAEAKYAVEIERFNAEQLKVQADNARIADALREASANQKETAKIEADAAYQYRKASERGVKITRQSGGITANISMAPVELAKPPDPPDDSSAAYLTRWDSAIRLANFGELALAIFTLIFIRIRSSRTNSPGADEDFPRVIDVEKRQPAKREKFSPKKEPAKNHGSFNSEGLKRLRSALRDISFRLHKRSFKSKVKGDAVWIFLMKARFGTQEAIHSAKANLSILDDATRMAPDKFRDRLEKFLRQSGFEI